jgi:hypothetical protein
VSATTIYDWCALWPVDKRASQAQRWSVLRILHVVADPVARSRGPGRPWLWRLKTPAAEGYPRRQIEIILEFAVMPILPILQTMA